jgi:hypothetical protein
VLNLTDIGREKGLELISKRGNPRLNRKPSIARLALKTKEAPGRNTVL